MKSAVFGLVLLAYCWSPAAGWGYIFSRFRPEANYWGYGGAGQQTPSVKLSPREQLMEAILGEELLEEQVCEGRRCTANEHCCSGYICADFDGASGTCMSSVNQQEGSSCAIDSECGPGLLCEQGTCMEAVVKTSYNGECSVSSECDISRGLCCQVVRRHRQAPRKVCSYFKDPMICIGHVEVDQVKRSKPDH